MDKKIRVLLADDHTVFRASICSLLNAQPDMEVVGEAADGTECIEKTHQLLPDVVLMDLSMPHIGGLKATCMIKNRFPNVRILILTMHDDDELFASALQAGASRYVLKDTEPRQLISSIRAVYEEHTQRGDSASWN